MILLILALGCPAVTIIVFATARASSTPFQTTLLRFTMQSTPSNGIATDTRVHMWMTHLRGDDRLTGLQSVTTDIQTGRVLATSLWKGPGSPLLEDAGGRCSYIKIPTRATLAAVITDSVGPVPLRRVNGFQRNATGAWVSNQGPILVIIRQPEGLGTRVVTETAQPLGNTIATITDVGVSDVASPSRLQYACHA